MFFNTNQNYPTFSIQQPTPTPMDVFKQTCQPQDNPLSIPMSLMHHHYSQDTMQSSVHFSYLRHMDQLKEKQEKFYAARHQRIQQQKGKLSTCSELPKCCERYTFLCETCLLMVPLTVVGFVLYVFFFYCLLIFGSSRCCVSERIPISYLEQVRDKYLNYDTRAQRKDFLLNCKDPRSRLARALFGIQ